MTVLVAHMDTEVRRRARQLLEPEGYEVLEADTAARALELCRAEGPAVVLLGEDMMSPDGTPLLDSIKRDIDLFRTGVVLVSSDLALESTQAALRRGAQDVLRNPFEPGELIARVHAAERTKTLQEELDEQSRRLEALIFGDELTGLPNRRFVLTQLSALVSGAKRHERPFSVLMIDIDHFKQINDTYGHAAGDAVLATVAGTLRERLREEDWVGRLGGEEFAALLPDEDLEAAAVVAESLRHAIENMGVRLEDQGEILRVTVSVGYATLEAGEDADGVLRRADDALYAAKAGGRNATRGAASLRRRL
jgi:two-component system, cell cycle response regulator